MKSKKNYIKRKVSGANIVGFEVFDQNGELIGILSSIMSTSSSDIWIVKCCNEEILIPALRSVVREVNVLRKKIFVVLPKEYEDVYSHMKSVDDVLEYKVCFMYED
ncbi:MAG: PRC-barrel domain-containing protein [Endomicrobium sp.]|jgi:16S rRNA processing protein RimM|nr:PRC-barrel domain-containing protein [Endomicrobium sp.]